MGDVDDDQLLIGMSKEAVTALFNNAGITYRIGQEDGEHYMLTCDYRPMRRTLTIIDGKVTDVRRG